MKERCHICSGTGLAKQRNEWMEWTESDCENCDGTGIVIIRDEDEDTE